MARYLAGILPPLTDDEARETTKVHSAAGHPLPPDRLLRRPPFRSPDHDASAVSLLGGGTEAMLPGELSLAHRGVLFLDELGEFSPVVLENLRQPIEEGVVHITRTTGTVTFPARCLLVGALHACPCRASGPQGACSCSPEVRERYYRRLPVRLLDRFDLRIDHLATDTRHQPGNPRGETGQAVRERVTDARQRARQRDVTGNAQLSAEALDNIAPLDHKATRTIERAFSEGALTGSGLTNVHRVALTVADLAGDEPPLDVDHVATALALRAHLAGIAGRVV